VRAGWATWSVSCAVDERNEAALRLYEGLGFEAQARRTAMVRVV
jgi:ribosomal protein S18 acetylase RimI-like enzyme